MINYTFGTMTINGIVYINKDDIVKFIATVAKTESEEIRTAMNELALSFAVAAIQRNPGEID